MAFNVVFLRRADAEVRGNTAWLEATRGFRAADRWRAGFLSAVVAALEADPHRYPEADEAGDLGLDLRELLYGRDRRVFRVLFTIEGDTVNVHAAQDRLHPTAEEAPGGADPVRPGVPQGAHRGHRVVLVRPPGCDRVPPPVVGGRAGHQRRPSGDRDPVRVRQGAAAERRSRVPRSGARPRPCGRPSSRCSRRRGTRPGRTTRTATSSPGRCPAASGTRRGCPPSSGWCWSTDGILLCTGSPDAEGTLGGLETGRRVHRHLRATMELAGLCIERPGVRPARRPEPARAPVPPRGRLPRVPARRRDRVRAGQRLPRPRAGRPEARSPWVPFTPPSATPCRSRSGTSRRPGASARTPR